MKYTALLLYLLLLCACESSTHVDIDAVIEEKVQERLDEFERIIRERCEDKVSEEAGRMADSIIIREARLQKDTMERPFRPDRPETPVLQSLEDSLPLAPFFEIEQGVAASSTQEES